MDASMQVLKIALKVLLVVPTCQPIHSSCSILLEFRECLCEVINTDVMEERVELAPSSFALQLTELRQPVARLCLVASQLLWRGQTSHDRTSSATAPRLPDAGQCSTHADAGQP